MGQDGVGALQPGLPQVNEDHEQTMPLLTPYQLGPFKLSHRVVMAPLTRSRSYGYVPQPHAILYYSQRASPGGFLISEGTGVSDDSVGFSNMPGIWTQEQVDAWKPIVQAVHDKGGIFFCQLGHCGRASHTSYQPNGAPPSSPSNLRFEGQVPHAVDGKMVDYSKPRAILTHEVPKYVEQFRNAARNAIEAGFDGVEIHACNSDLIDQFLRDSINDRTDKYGGSMENRSRFLVEVVEALTKEIGGERVGVRVSPFQELFGIYDSNPKALALHIGETLDNYNLLYLHAVEPRFQFAGETETGDSLWPMRRAYKGVFLSAGGYDKEAGNEAIESGKSDLAVYGRFFIANPDLPRRFVLNAPLNKQHRETFYISDPVVGYTDYPFLEQLYS